MRPAEIIDAAQRPVIAKLLLGLAALAAALIFTIAGAYAAPRNSTSTAGLPAPLVAKLTELKAACGSRIVSTYRPGAHTPSGHLSNHARHRAADVKGNPRCIYRHLKGWPGGFSTDYARAPGGAHVHISYNPRGMEWGLRFAHNGKGGRHRTRLASVPAVMPPTLSSY